MVDDHGKALKGYLIIQIAFIFLSPSVNNVLHLLNKKVKLISTKTTPDGYTTGSLFSADDNSHEINCSECLDFKLI